MEPKVYKPNQVDISQRGRPDGFVFNEIKKELEQQEHIHCGTPKCCGVCDTATTETETDGRV